MRPTRGELDPGGDARRLRRAGARHGACALARVAPTGHRLGVAYNEVVVVEGGGGGYSFTLTEGALPPGLALEAASGVVHGVPTWSSTYFFTVKVDSADGESVTGPIEIVVYP